MAAKKALIAGATGLIGKALLRYLLESKSYNEVIAIVRSPLGFTHPKLNVQIVDFNQLAAHAQLFAVDDVFCCLGTTIKKAKTKEAMYTIDVKYPLEMARLTQQQGARHFLVVSSMNANARSAIWYAKMKGELEERLKQLPLASLSIIQPSLLLGHRKEHRTGERLAALFFKATRFLFQGPLLAYKAIEGEKVALAMLRIAEKNEIGVRTYPNAELHRLAESCP